MSKNLVENRNYILTRYCMGKKKLGYQITQKTHNDLSYDYVLLTKKNLQHMLKKIEEDEND